MPHDDGAHPSVEQAHAKAYVLTTPSRPFLEALARVAGPQRLAVAKRLQADATVKDGIAGWGLLDEAAAFKLLQYAGRQMCEELGYEPPTMKVQPGVIANRAGLYDDASDTLAINAELLKTRSAYSALATVLHEVRHAIQHRIVAATQTDNDLVTLAAGYKARPAAGNPAAYGDYVHLTTEFDAFQFGNCVASILSKGKFDDTQFGTVDTHFDAKGLVIFDLLNLPAELDLKGRILAVNVAEADALGLIVN
ncbi:MAG: hypothetical protein JWM80_4690 [Cyanobacteria bacterium RYN_339]|nr:hypothetical protein [Cyanobacteria bacterium RYN_339]